MIQWKQRLYAFLLRRLLEPVLDQKSLQKLHESVDVSIQEGSFRLLDVDLNVAWLQRRLESTAATSSLRVERVHIERLEIHLQLLESDHHDAAEGAAASMSSSPSNKGEARSSFMWRAVQLTRSNSGHTSATTLPSGGPANQPSSAAEATSSVYLLARVEIDGVMIEVCPTDVPAVSPKVNPSPAKSTTDPASTSTTTTTSNAQNSSSSSILSSYIEAALSSLRLALKISNLRVRVVGRPDRAADGTQQQQSEPSFLELRLNEACYDTVPISSSPTATTMEPHMFVHKTLTLQTLSLHIGTVPATTTTDQDAATPTSSPSVTTIALLQGPNQICLRAYQYEQEDGSAPAGIACARIQQDVEVNLQQRLNISVDEESLRQLIVIARDYRRASPTTVPVEQIDTMTLQDDVDLGHTGTTIVAIDAEPGYSERDRADLDALGDIMKQYQEARRLVERQEIRGGLLLPSTDVVEDGEVTFDAFFDANEFFEANEYSIHRYSVSLRQSIMESASLETSSAKDFVHTKLRFHLKEAGIKVSFPASPSAESSRPAPVEYVMVTINDVNESSLLSLQSMEHSISATHLDMEVSRLDQAYGQGTSNRRIEIETLLSFSPLPCREDESLGDHDILLQTPSISIHAKTASKGETRTTDVEVSLSPCELNYHKAVVSSLTGLVRAISRRDDEVVRTADGDGTVKSGGAVCLRASCASVTVACPVAREDDWTALYRRCGYEKHGTTMTKSRIGFVIDQLSLQLNDNTSENELLSVSCYHVCAFAASPYGRHAMKRKVRLLEFFHLSGLTEVNPVIPVSFSLFRKSIGGSENENPGRKSFPVVPSLSSFKARQEDEDEENRIDRILHSRLQGVESDIRKGLRTNHPQQDMLSAASQSETVLVVNAPEILCDVSTQEIALLSQMLSSLIDVDLKPEQEVAGFTGGERERADSSPTTCVSCSFACDLLSLTFHGGIPHALDSADCELSHSSFMMKADQVKAHVLMDGGSARQARFLAHEVNFHEVPNVVPSINEEFSSRHEGDLRARTADTTLSSVVPIVHRSYLFAPISRESPSILLDWVRVVEGNCDADQDFSQMNVHLTLYDLTYRYDFASEWLERCRSMIQEVGHAEKDSLVSPTHSKSLTRMFFSVADCNIDYSSSPDFKTASRAILRVGDMRVSSNVVRPVLPVQAFTIGLGDCTVYLCPNRCPYNFENECLLASPSLMRPEDTSLDHLGLSTNATSEEVFRAMNYRTMLMLDSMDAIVALATTDSRAPETPRVRVSLTLGELAVFSCKDSFACFVSTIGELQTRLTAVDDAGMAALKASSCNHSESDVGPTSREEEAVPDEPESVRTSEPVRSIPSFIESAAPFYHSNEFLLDGYDWTTIDADGSNACRIPPGEEQQSRWYGAGPGTLVDSKPGEAESSVHSGSEEAVVEEAERIETFEPRIIEHHFHLQPTSDPFGDGDMGAAKYAAGESSPEVQTRLLVHNLRLKLRCFDGYDWPELLDAPTRAYSGKRAFVIDDDVGMERDRVMKEQATQNINDNMKRQEDTEALKRKAKLMGGLLDGADIPEPSTTFRGVPLPEERGQMLKEQADLRRLARRTSKFLQICASGVKVRLDSFFESSDHQLVSCMNVLLDDFFISETISNDRPVKMAGEWVNETEHPRESEDGIIMMKMVTWHPNALVTDDEEIANDECIAAVKILPLRCVLDQRATRFTRRFFQSEDSDKEDDLPLPKGLHAIPPPSFKEFSVRSFKLKIDYTPEKVDTRALRDGAFVELINLSSLDAMVLTLLPIEVDSVIGLTDVLGIVVRRWIEHICATQIHKFLSNTRALEPFTHVGGKAVDMIVLPWEAIRNGEGIRKAMRSGMHSFLGAVTYETLTTSSRVAEYMAQGVAKVSGSMSPGSNPLPFRPLETPRSAIEATPHGVESIARGLQTANYRIVIIPYREYRRSGTKGAVTSILRGIPVAIAAPASGAVEALSFALLGTRNQLQPDVRREEEARSRGLQQDR